MFRKQFSLASLCIFSFLFCSFFLVSVVSAETNVSFEQLKRSDIEQAMQYDRLKSIEEAGTSKRVSTQALPVDTDDDGMPDSWESANGLNPNDPDDAWLDPDGDEVVNLFEYQLGSDLNNPAKPPVATVAPSGADYTDVGTAIDAVAPGTAIHVAGASYNVNYTTFSSKVVMIQGGWSTDFSQRDLKLYPTTFDGRMQGEILYFSVSSGEPVIILDGINFIRGKGTFGAVNLLASNSAFMKTSIFNCSITESESDFSFGGVLFMINWNTSESDRTIANTLIAGNESSGIYGQITGNTIVHWRMVNTTISDNLNGGGNNGDGIEAFTNDNGWLTAHIYNSIIWRNARYDINIDERSTGFINFEADHSDIGSVNAVFGATYLPGTGIISNDPLFVDPANGDYHLSSASSCIDVGINQGIPLIDFEEDPRIWNTTVDMGFDEYVSGSGSCNPGETQECGSDDGECQKGTQTCTNESWSDCEGEVGPSAEVCDDSKDNDCDGETDEADCEEPPVDYEISDINGDGCVDIMDVLCIYRWVVGNPSSCKASEPPCN